MLLLRHITKDYSVGDLKVPALRGLDICFRENEFVAVLGPSGCGKTTLLNIIGGLDRYSTGDLSVNGRSTKEYNDNDWDSYRNHSIGFIFQTYNLIHHQTVLANVELALTLSGVSRAERRARAEEVLRRVGLGDQMNKKPNQMSGGQMQRVAIARALINDPDILLADEPTGALDTETSIQVMDLLREVAHDKLVIMVTHNPALAGQYATRTVRLLDGVITDDSNPMPLPQEPSEDGEAVGEKASTHKKVRKNKHNGAPKKPSMSFFTALSLSLNNLLTKKARTTLTSFAGSIGIVGIALIMSVSGGFQSYISRVEEDTLSSYPIMITGESMDINSLMETFAGNTDKKEEERDPDKVYSNDVVLDLFGTLMSEVKINNLNAFRSYIEGDEGAELRELAGSVQYSYNINMQIYSPDTENGILQINPSPMMANIRGQASSMPMMPGGINIWQELIGDRELLDTQFEVVAGKWPENKNEIVLVLNENNEISDMALYSLGIKDQNELNEIIKAIMNGEKYEQKTTSYTYDELLATKFSVVVNTDIYSKENGAWADKSADESYMKDVIANSEELSVVGILRPAEGIVATSVSGVVGYTNELTKSVIDAVNNSEIVKEQKENPDTDIFTGLPFDDGVISNPDAATKRELFSDYVSSLSDADKSALMIKIAASLDDEAKAEMVDEMLAGMSEADKLALLTEHFNSLTSEDINSLFAEYAASMPAEQKAQFEQFLSLMSDEDKKSMLMMIAAPTTEVSMLAMQQYFLSLIATEKYEKLTAEQFASMTTAEIAAMLDDRVKNADDAEMENLFATYMPAFYSTSTYEENEKKLSAVDLDSPDTISIYPRDFASKERISEIIKEYNREMTDSGQEEGVINYTDYIGLFLSSISTIIDIISYVLIAFVAISLVVSSIMIGVITYISVLERTKEIGILRSIGASKRDISRVFNAETLIVGFTSGMMGILATLILIVPLNIVLKALTDIPNLAVLPWVGAIFLVIISMVLTLVAGLIPSGIAANKDPVVALRTE